MKIIVLMAGEGRRFAGFQSIPKPLAKLGNVELIKWAVSSYNFLGLSVSWSDVFFITREEHIKDFYIDQRLKEMFSPKVNIRYVKQTTRGPAETAMLLEKEIPADEQVIISDCDMFFNSLPLYIEIIIAKNNPLIWGILPYVKRDDDQNSWSYAQLDKDKKLIKVNEKDEDMFKAGCPGIVGAYAFNRWEYFTNEAQKMIDEDDLSGEEHKKEFYMSKVFQRFIKQGRTVIGVDVYPAWILGTPAQFVRFESLLKGVKGE